MNVLERGLYKLRAGTAQDETKNFIAMCAERRRDPLAMPRERILTRWELSHETFFALEDHFALEISAAAAAPGAVSGVERSLPPGDRE